MKSKIISAEIEFSNVLRNKRTSPEQISKLNIVLVKMIQLLVLLNF